MTTWWRLQWTPAREIRRPQQCACCGVAIPPCFPGTAIGKRWAKAWFCKEIAQFECTECRSLGRECEMAAMECAACARGVPRHPFEAGWIHRHAHVEWGGNPGGNLGGNLIQVATYACTFQNEQVATSQEAA
jgi:hypothetical protein